jgi:hypothetical protein
MNESLLRAMEILYTHSTLLPEGDYLNICNHLKTAYEEQTGPIFFFDYMNFTVPNIDPSDELYTYFRMRATDLDWEFIQGQINYLEKEMFENRPLIRITKGIRDKVIWDYCKIHEDVTPDTFKMEPKQFNATCKVYMDIENTFREQYRNAIEKRIVWLENADDRLDP